MNATLTSNTIQLIQVIESWSFSFDEDGNDVSRSVWTLQGLSDGLYIYELLRTFETQREAYDYASSLGGMIQVNGDWELVGALD